MARKRRGIHRVVQILVRALPFVIAFPLYLPGDLVAGDSGGLQVHDCEPVVGATLSTDGEAWEAWRSDLAYWDVAFSPEDLRIIRIGFEFPKTASPTDIERLVRLYGQGLTLDQVVDAPDSVRHYSTTTKALCKADSIVAEPLTDAGIAEDASVLFCSCVDPETCGLDQSRSLFIVGDIIHLSPAVVPLLTEGRFLAQQKEYDQITIDGREVVVSSEVFLGAAKTVIRAERLTIEPKGSFVKDAAPPESGDGIEIVAGTIDARPRTASRDLRVFEFATHDWRSRDIGRGDWTGRRTIRISTNELLVDGKDGPVTDWLGVRWLTLDRDENLQSDGVDSAYCLNFGTTGSVGECEGRPLPTYGQELSAQMLWPFAFAAKSVRFFSADPYSQAVEDVLSPMIEEYRKSWDSPSLALPRATVESLSQAILHDTDLSGTTSTFVPRLSLESFSTSMDEQVEAIKTRLLELRYEVESLGGSGVPDVISVDGVKPGTTTLAEAYRKQLDIRQVATSLDREASTLLAEIGNLEKEAADASMLLADATKDFKNEIKEKRRAAENDIKWIEGIGTVATVVSSIYYPPGAVAVAGATAGAREKRLREFACKSPEDVNEWIDLLNTSSKRASEVSKACKGIRAAYSNLAEGETGSDSQKGETSNTWKSIADLGSSVAKCSQAIKSQKKELVRTESCPKGSSEMDKHQTRLAHLESEIARKESRLAGIARRRALVTTEFLRTKATEDVLQKGKHFVNGVELAKAQLTLNAVFSGLLDEVNRQVRRSHRALLYRTSSNRRTASLIPEHIRRSIRARLLSLTPEFQLLDRVIDRLGKDSGLLTQRNGKHPDSVGADFENVINKIVADFDLLKTDLQLAEREAKASHWWQSVSESVYEADHKDSDPGRAFFIQAINDEIGRQVNSVLKSGKNYTSQVRFVPIPMRLPEDPLVRHAGGHLLDMDFEVTGWSEALIGFNVGLVLKHPGSGIVVADVNGDAICFTATLGEIPTSINRWVRFPSSGSRGLFDLPVIGREAYINPPLIADYELGVIVTSRGDPPATWLEPGEPLVEGLRIVFRTSEQ